MPTFAYTARTLSGELKSATLDAVSRDDVVVQLRRQKLIVVKIDEEQKKLSLIHISEPTRPY